jgi:hypothetical protein
MYLNILQPEHYSCRSANEFVDMQDWDRQNPTQIVTEACGFVTILSGTFLLHKTKDMADGIMSLSAYGRAFVSS